MLAPHKTRSASSTVFPSPDSRRIFGPAVPLLKEERDPPTDPVYPHASVADLSESVFATLISARKLPNVGRAGQDLRGAPGSHSYFSGELWVSDLTTWNIQRLFPDVMLTHFSISQDGKKVAFATDPGQARSGIWIAWLDRTQPPRQLTFEGEYRVFFGKPGRLLFQGSQAVPKIMSIGEDGTGEITVSPIDFMQLQNVSPDGRWALVGVTPHRGHGTRRR